MKKSVIALIAAVICVSACDVGESSYSKIETNATQSWTSDSTKASSSKTQTSTRTTSSSSQTDSTKTSSSSASSSTTATSSKKTYSVISGTITMNFPTYAPGPISGNIDPGKGITVSAGLPISYCVFSGAQSNQSGNAAFVNTSSLKVHWNNGVIFRSALLDIKCTTKTTGSVQLISGDSYDNHSIEANSYNDISFTDTKTESLSYITSFNFSGDYGATSDFVAILSKIAFNVLA